MVNEDTQMNLTAIFKNRNGIVEPTCTHFNKWKQVGLPVHKIRRDNAGENIFLKTLANGKYWKLDLTFG